ncbi:cAMP-dependent protein kinase catalytic subunit [Coemansia sp. IMI 209127]|nr:cAMP-dependent protein kinase catalytic subunit [Coemansia sp. IMI 209127]
MAFINKIIQKTKTKISERDSSSSSSGMAFEKPPQFQGLDSLTNPVPMAGASAGAGYQQNYIATAVVTPPVTTYATVPSQRHVVPSNAPVQPTSTSVATRAASFSVGVQSAGKGAAVYIPQHGEYNAHVDQAMYQQQQQQPPQQHEHLLHLPGHNHNHNHNHNHSLNHNHNQHNQHNQHNITQHDSQLMMNALPLALQTGDRPQMDTHVQLGSFEIFRTVGTGSFGRVRLVRHKETGKYFAMKVLRKSHVVRAKQVEHVNSERRILAECNCPFIVYMLGTCQDQVNLYFFMEYVVGGELFTYLRRYHQFPSPVAKFYAAEVLLALEYMHARNIIWRDTKPENILLDSSGHVKLTDMGFAKKVEEDRTWTLCGTPDYLAPEVIQAKGYGRSVDWWALGVLIFEMIAGYPPFYDEDHYRLYEKIMAGRIQWPAQFDPVARDLVSRLLTADLSRRLGNLHRGSADIKDHRWFAEVDWNRLAAREIPAPLIPTQKVDGDTSNFDRYPETAETYGDMTSEDPYANLFPDF